VRSFLVDNQLPATLALWLESKGCAAKHVLALQLAQSHDELIWEYAARHGYIIISKDEDFADLTIVRSEKVPVVWLRMGNCRTPTLLSTLERAWPDIVRQLDAGVRLIEVL
jgi:predicted nuclease of predicted toxin-antitoxin system